MRSSVESLKLDSVVKPPLVVITSTNVPLLHRTLQHKYENFITDVSYAAQGVSRSSRENLPVRFTVGIICDSWPSWLFGFLHTSFSVIWVLLKNDFWINVLSECFPSITFHLARSSVELACPQILAVSDSSALVDNFLEAQVLLFDWEAKLRGLKRWNSCFWRVRHDDCGGVSDLLVPIKCYINPLIRQSFKFDPGTILCDTPRSSLSSILDTKVKGSALLQGPRLAQLTSPQVTTVHGNSVFHYQGLYPSQVPAPEFFIPCVFVPSKWVRRQLQPFELLRVFDLPVLVEKALSHRKSKLLIPLLKSPSKCLTSVTNGLFLASTAAIESINSADAGGGLSFPSAASHSSGATLPIGWKNNQAHDRDERAAKRDDAEVPVELWHDHLAMRLGKQKLSNNEIKAVSVIRSSVLRVWKRSIGPCFVNWLRCKKCHNNKLRKRFAGCYLYDNHVIPEHSTYCKTHKKKLAGSWVVWADNRYQWAAKGKRKYHLYWNLVLKGSSKLEREDIQESINAYLECMEKVYKCKEWTWDGGSRTFFWRWGDHWKGSRDGARVHVKSNLPNCRDKQSIPKDQKVKEKIIEKLSDVRMKGYIKRGEVKSLTSFFAVPKSDDDIRMVYNGTSSGLNDAVWAPWFALPTVDTHLRATVPETYMCDIDLSEMFLNFMLDKELRAYAGVDFSKLFKEEISKGGTLWECWVRMLMGFKPSPYLTTREMRRIEEFLIGNRENKNNVFRWSKVIFNLPGSKSYNPSLPRVYRVRVEGTVAGDLFIYIDDLRVTCPTKEECWEGAHQVCCRLTWLGLQDAPRKRSEVSTTPRAWAGSIVHTDNDTVSVLIAQKKWLKAKKWIEWMHSCLAVSERLNHKELERCRGFLIYVSRTYKSMRPYLRGLHMTIENWRPNRDEEGWRIIDAFKDDEDIATHDNSSHNVMESPEEFVQAVPRLRNDVEVLKKLLRSEAPPKVSKRRSKLGKAYYGMGDASGKGFGYAVDIDGKLYDEFGEWKAAICEQSSNYRELRNLKNAVERLAKENLLEDAELFLFTDNFVAERAYYNGGSSQSKYLDALVFELWDLQMHHDFDLYVYHIAGTRMIECGVDGLSRGDKGEGVAKGLPVLDFIPIHLSPFERADTLEEWCFSWWNLNNTLGKLTKMSSEDWFTDYNKRGSYLWNVAPTAGESAVEQLCAHIHAQPYSNHVFLIPRLCTNHWRKQLLKACDVVLTLKIDSPFWPINNHEPLILGLYFSLLPPHSRFAPWRLKYTRWLEDKRCKMQQVQAEGKSLDGRSLWELFDTSRRLPSMPKRLARQVLSTKNSGQISSFQD